MGEEVPPGNGEKCSDARSTTVVRNVRAGTNLLSESWNLFGQVELRNYQGSPPAPPPQMYGKFRATTRVTGCVLLRLTDSTREEDPPYRC